MDIINSEDNRLNGNYNVYIDTISETNESYFLQLTLDTEKTYIQAIRSKLKHYYPPQHHTRTKPKQYGSGQFFKLSDDTQSGNVSNLVMTHNQNTN